jgi:hypothetical protein
MRSRGFTAVWTLPVAGVAMVALAWTIPQDRLAEWMTHPVRAHGAEAATVAAAWARWGWTIGGAMLAAMPWLLHDPCRGTEERATVSTRWLVLSMAVAVALRIHLSGQGLWYDEIASAMTYTVHGPNVIMANAFTTANHPLQSLLSWCCLPLGVEPWIRLPSILSGALAVLGCWWIGRVVSPSTTLAAWCAGAMAIMPAAVNAGSEARGYGLMIAASSISGALALQAMRHGGTARWTAMAIVLALGVWAHFVTALVGVGQAVLGLWALRDPHRRPQAWRLLVAVGCAGVLAMALWSPAMPDLIASRSQFTARRGDEPTLAGPQGLLLLWQLVGMTPLPLHKAGVDRGLAMLTGLLPAVLLVVGLATVARRRELRHGLAMIGLGLPAAILIAWITGSWLYARFLLFAAPATALLLGVAAQRLVEGRAGAPTTLRQVLGAVAVLSGAALYMADDLTAAPRQPIREAVARVASLRAPDERVIGIGIADDVVQWYALAFDVPIEPTGVGGERLSEVLDRTDAHWIVALYPDHRHPAATASSIAKLGFRRRPVHGFVGWLDGGEGTVEVWERRTEGP